MKKKNLHLTFRHALKQYKRYTRKYSKLFRAGNTSMGKLDFLKKRIGRLKAFLEQAIQKTKLATAAGAVALVLTSSSASAQNFLPQVTNPFGIAAVPGFFAPTLVDLDNDGDLDLMTGDNDYGSFTYYQNTGSATAPAFGPAQVNPFGLADLGAYNTPTFTDLDGDGDFDMMVGSNNDLSMTTYTYLYGTIYYYENTGTASAPAFGPAQPNPFGITLPTDTFTGYYTYTYSVLAYSDPTLEDLDGDGDLDMLVGNDSNGDLYYYQNNGTVSAPAFAAPVVTPFGLTAFASATAPDLVDFDGDGDNDIFVADQNGDIFYLENTGTAMAPAFAAESTNPFGLANIGTSYGNVELQDIDNDGDLDIFTGTDNGDLVFQEQCILPDASTTTAGATITATLSGATYQWIDCGTMSPIGGETNQSFTATADGDYAVIVENGGCSDTSGCVNITGLGINDFGTSQHLLVYPNPSNGSFTVKSHVTGNFVLQNEVGQVVQTIQMNTANANTIRIEGLSNGVYFITGTNKGIITRHKIVVAK